MPFLIATIACDWRRCESASFDGTLNNWYNQMMFAWSRLGTLYLLTKIVDKFKKLFKICAKGAELVTHPSDLRITNIRDCFLIFGLIANKRVIQSRTGTGAPLRLVRGPLCPQDKWLLVSNRGPFSRMNCTAPKTTPIRVCVVLINSSDLETDETSYVSDVKMRERVAISGCHRTSRKVAIVDRKGSLLIAR